MDESDTSAAAGVAETIPVGRNDTTSGGAKGPEFGASRMTQRIEARKATVKPQHLEPKHPPIYPVYSRTAPAGVRPDALRVHPKGFRMLSKASPLERNMTSYFRLPAQPPKRMATERDALKTVIDKVVGSATGTDGVVLNGFMMLEATGVEDPADATSVTICDSNVVGAVADDLSYFVNITTADFGENVIPLSELTSLSGLETLHLHCNCLSGLGGLSHGVFPKLHTLNLSFNQISEAQLSRLAHLPLLERLDLSCNALGDLPADFRGLRSLRQLALENNRLSKASVFKVLGRLPALEEVNLNYNRLATVPSLRQLMDEVAAEEGAEDDEEPGGASSSGAAAAAAADPDVDHAATAADPRGAFFQRGVLFPKLIVLGMGANRFVYFEDLFNLNEMPSLQQVVLWGNPIENRRKDAEVLTFELGQRDIAVIMEPPVPGKKTKAAFFAESKKDHVKVPAVDGRGMPRSSKGFTKKGTHVPQNRNATTTLEEPMYSEDAGGSFFMTQSNAINSASHHPQDPGAATPTQPRQGYASFHSSVGGEQQQQAQQQQQPHRPTRLGRMHGAGSMASATGARSLPSPVTGDQQRGGISRGTDDLDGDDVGPSSVELRFRELAARVDSTTTAPRRNGNIRSVMSELRNMLRQPLPPLNRPRFAGSTKANNRPQQQREATDSEDEEGDDHQHGML
jgi:hypothetical protein